MHNRYTPIILFSSIKDYGVAVLAISF